MEIINHFSAIEWSLAFFAAFCIGLSKAGIRGIDVANVTIMALVFGSKQSTGIVLFLLCLADVFAVIYYNRHAQWKYMRILLPWLIVGVLLGVWIGQSMNEAVFKIVIGCIILAAIALLLFFEYKKEFNVPAGGLFGASMGIISGITTMLGNLAGAFTNVYFLALKLPKDNFIGTVSWLFLIVNLFKVPFQIYYWKNVNLDSLRIDMLMIPFVVVGFFIGTRIVKKLTNDNYRKMILVLTIIGAVAIFFR